MLWCPEITPRSAFRGHVSGAEGPFGVLGIESR